MTSGQETERFLQPRSPHRAQNIMKLYTADYAKNNTSITHLLPCSNVKVPTEMVGINSQMIQ